DGENGGGGDRTNCVASTGGKAGAIPANTGSLTSSFGGGSGGYITSCKSNFWTLNESYYNPGRGGGGNGGWQAFAGNTGGSGQVRIRVTYPMP
ncbi:MAG: hypothetical protein FWC26_00085, partial [Fibromonadales bacterium]|nr:hypothetical protein [Fibromonadales bacterium]